MFCSLFPGYLLPLVCHTVVSWLPAPLRYSDVCRPMSSIGNDLMSSIKIDLCLTLQTILKAVACLCGHDSRSSGFQSIKQRFLHSLSSSL